MPSKHTEQPFTAQSFGAGNLHIHPSDVPVINLPLLSKTRLSMETTPHQRGENLTQVRGTEYLLRIQTCKPVSSVGADYRHIHPSDVPVMNPQLQLTRLSTKTFPHQRGTKPSQVRGSQFGVLRNIQTCKPLSLVGAGHPHIHPSDVPVKMNPSLLRYTLEHENSPPTKGTQAISVLDSQFGAMPQNITSKPLSSLGADYHHIHPSDVTVKFPPFLTMKLLLTMKLGAQIISDNSGNQFHFSTFPICRPNSISELQLCSSAPTPISAKPPILPANQRRGNHFYFLTADWPPTWRTPSVHKENMAEVQAKPGAQIAASPVPQQTAPAVVLPAGAASTVTTPELKCFHD